MGLMLSESAKHRFCKDMGVKIRVFSEPYFSERIKLLNYESEYNDFCNMIANRYSGDEQAFFKESAEISDTITEYIKDTDTFKLLNHLDMSEYAVKNNIVQGDIYKACNVGKEYISIDLSKANFTALVWLSKIKETAFLSKEYTSSLDVNMKDYDYGAFIRKFTDNDYFVKSKYIRQVIFGKCNPKRIIKIEKYIMDSLLEAIKYDVVDIKDSVVALCNDEIIIDVSVLGLHRVELLHKIIDSVSSRTVPLHFEYFKLGKNAYGDTFIKQIYNDDSRLGWHYELKCNNPIETVYVNRYLKGQMPLADDLVFESEYGLAKLLREPKCYINI